MTGNEFIDLSLENIWRSWFIFRKGKHCTAELHNFQYYLEENLCELYCDLRDGTYMHGSYRKFIVCDNKRREISVACIRDRVVHRLLYDYLNNVYDNRFMYDVWSCRKGKGLLGAIEKIQSLLKKFPDAYIWKVDIKKFFDNVDHRKLREILRYRIKDPVALGLLHEVIRSFSTGDGTDKGIPIGNLTSQIFANIYLNELDRYVKLELQPVGYVRYGDDFILIEHDRQKLSDFRVRIKQFLPYELDLSLHVNVDKIIKPKHSLKFLGVVVWPTERKLNKRNRHRAINNVNLNNYSSYYGLVHKHENENARNMYDWWLYEKAIS